MIKLLVDNDKANVLRKGERKYNKRRKQAYKKRRETLYILSRIFWEHFEISRGAGQCLLQSNLLDYFVHKIDCIGYAIFDTRSRVSTWQSRFPPSVFHRSKSIVYKLTLSKHGTRDKKSVITHNSVQALCDRSLLRNRVSMLASLL